MFFFLACFAPHFIVLFLLDSPLSNISSYQNWSHLMQDELFDMYHFCAVWRGEQMIWVAKILHECLIDGSKFCNVDSNGQEILLCRPIIFVAHSLSVVYIYKNSQLAPLAKILFKLPHISKVLPSEVGMGVQHLCILKKCKRSIWAKKIVCLCAAVKKIVCLLDYVKKNV